MTGAGIVAIRPGSRAIVARSFLTAVEIEARFYRINAAMAESSRVFAEMADVLAMAAICIEEFAGSAKDKRPRWLMRLHETFLSVMDEEHGTKKTTAN